MMLEQGKYLKLCRVVVVGLALAVLSSGAALALERHPWSLRPGAVVSAATDEKVVALSFDDGPDPRWTPVVMHLLRRYRAGATFFLVGNNALAHPELVRQLRAGGYEIANHTLSHPNLARLKPEQVRTEIQGGVLAIERAGGVRPTLLRPPLGITTPAVANVARNEGYRTILWTLALEHFVNHRDVTSGVNLLLARVHPGSIILAHDGGIPDRARTLQGLPLLLDGLRAKGYRAVDVSTLLARPA